VNIVKDIALELTLKCNLNCRMCSRQFLSDKTSEMDFSLLTEMLAEFKRDHGEAPVNFSLGGYGEPLLYPRLYEAIALIKDLFPQSQLTMTSNAHLLNQAAARRLLESGLDYVRFSLNATSAEEYRRLIGSDRFHLAEQNIEYLLRQKQATPDRLKVGIQILDTTQNRIGFPIYKKRWEELFSGEDFITYRMMENRGGVIDSSDLSQGSSPASLQERWPCYALWRYLSVDTQGRVYCCCEAYTFREKPTLLCLGSLKQSSLAQISGSAALARIQDMHLRNDYAALPECAHCTKPINYPNVWEKHDGVWVEKL
jgi:organic radical activating enzyme